MKKRQVTVSGKRITFLDPNDCRVKAGCKNGDGIRRTRPHVMRNLLKSLEKEKVMEALETRIKEVIEDITALPEGADRTFDISNLGMDSLDVTEVVIELEDEFGDEGLIIEDSAAMGWKTLGDIFDYVKENIKTPLS